MLISERGRKISCKAMVVLFDDEGEEEGGDGEQCVLVELVFWAMH